MQRDELHLDAVTVTQLIKKGYNISPDINLIPLNQSSIYFKVTFLQYTGRGSQEKIGETTSKNIEGSRKVSTTEYNDTRKTNIEKGQTIKSLYSMLPFKTPVLVIFLG